MTTDLTIDGFLDIETSDWTRFAMGGLSTGDRDFEYLTDSDEYFDCIMDHGGSIWAWNGGRFDFLWFLQIARERSIRAIIYSAGTRVTRIDCGNLILRDAIALIPMSLKKAAKIVNHEMTKDTGLRCICGLKCGGYCAITPSCEGMNSRQRASLAEYLSIDCRVGHRIVETVIQHAKDHSYVLKGTIGGSAWATARSIIPELGKSDWRDGREYQQAADGYFGGRVTVGRISASSGYRYDINSAYPAALSTLELPWGQRYEVTGKDAEMAFKNGYEGIYRCIVDVENVHLPPLPVRTAKGRVCFMTGRLVGSWTALELRHAIENGATIKRFSTALVWSEVRVVFKDLMSNIYQVRSEVGKESGLGIWQKFLGNSFTGKLAQSPESSRILMHPEKEPVLCPAPECSGICSRSRCCEHHCSGRCRRWKQVDLDGAIWAIPTWRIPECGHVHFAAYLTAWTRVKLHKMASQFGVGFLYSDTDSVFAMTESHDKYEVIGKTLGTWSYDGRMYEFECIAPKAYRYRDENGKWHIKLKGIPNATYDDFNAYRDGAGVTYSRGVKGLRSAARGRDGLFVRQRFTRASRADGVWYGDRRRYKTSPLTRPVTYAEQSARERHAHRERVKRGKR